MVPVRPVPVKSVSVYKSKSFARFQKRAKLTDRDLWMAVQAAENGLIDADLGGGVIKQRIARAGQGKSGGSRSIVLFRKGNRAVYVYGFEKKDRPNIRPEEVEAFKELAAVVLGYTDAEMFDRVNDGALIAVAGPGEESDGKKIS
ncbi:type II toxin-antitoxin system RelE/ParE family toxin [Terriglobus sp. ADX1]|uniref:type II toxin-antitoxin system RelE/ParE family toxin n=1 Tax=Terriglobus sp. ADX1 TaxID=2794063 RepID=UPI002FE54F68